VRVFNRVLITGANGNLGRKLANYLKATDCEHLVLLDRTGDKEVIEADLSCWSDQWAHHFHDVDAVVHLAGNPVAYHDWAELVGPNIDAMLNVYEASVRYGVGRVVFASSNHVMGGYQDGPQIQITETLPSKPGLRYFADGAERFSGAYAATKLFGEQVGRHYALIDEMDVIALRLGWVWRGVNEPSELPVERGEWFRNMWLSDRDFLHLMERCLTASLPERFQIFNGMSANTGMRWDLTAARTVLGYSPQDDVNAPR
jgi:NAD+ dependent glucose-6-phosphate dehydrogenase